MTLFLDFIVITGILLAGLILFFLTKKDTKNFPHRILIAIFIIILLVFINSYALLHKIKVLYVSTVLFNTSVDVFIGPILFVYVGFIVEKSKNGLRKYIPHFIFPVIYFIFVSIPVFFKLINPNIDIFYILKWEHILVFSILYSLAYCILAYRKLIWSKLLIKQNYSNLKHKDLNWISLFLLGCITIICIDISSSIYEFVYGDMGWQGQFISIVPIVFMIGYLGYYGISQSKILLPNFLLEKSKDDYAKNNHVYDILDLQNIKKEMEILMQTEKPYLNANLTLGMLSNMLKVSDKKISTLLNQEMNTSFYDYINGFRVEEVKRRLKTNDVVKLNLLGIAFESGFNSKSSFNRIFKKMTNTSPSNYQKHFF